MRFFSRLLARSNMAKLKFRYRRDIALYNLGNWRTRHRFERVTLRSERNGRPTRDAPGAFRIEAAQPVEIVSAIAAGYTNVTTNIRHGKRDSTGSNP